MALVVKDRVLETSNTNGTGTFTLAGAVNGFQEFSVIGVGNTTYYTITEETNNQWEVGIGTVGSGTLTRDTVLSSSNSGNKVDFADGLKQVFCDYPASKSLFLDNNGNLTTNNLFEGFSNTAASGTQIVLTAASVPSYVITGSGGQTIKLPDATTLPNGTTFSFNNNQSSGAISVNNNSNTLVVSIPSGAFTIVTLLSNSIAAGSWDTHDQAPANVSWSTNTFNYVGSITGATWNGNTVQVNRGGTGAATLTGLVVGNGTSAMTTVTAPSGTVVGTSDTQTLTNKTLTSPVVNTPAITGGTIDNTVIGATTPAAGTFTTITGQTEVLKGTGTNLLTQSSVLTNAAWSQTNITLTGSQTDPFGGTTASLFNDGTVNGQHYINQFLSLSSNVYTFSVYAKSGTTNYVGLFGSVAGQGAFFNLNTGAFSANLVGAPTAYSITNAGNGWYRCSITITTSSSNFYVYMSEDGTNFSFTGTSKTIYVAAPQLEVGTYVNTYIPTTTTAIYGTPTLSFSGVAGLGLQSDGSLYVSPAGTGAIQAQATTSSTVGGNARGANAVDWQTSRSAASQVASGQYSNILGGIANTSVSYGSVLVGGSTNYSSGTVAFLGGGGSNTTGGNYSSLVGGGSNSSLGYYNFIGGGFTNSATSGSAVTTQSATMNGTTAVTLSGSNASIKVGQYITGTSIAQDTYVAAISGTSLTLSKNASGSSTSTLSFYTPHGVVVGGGNNQATGSYSFIGGGGDAGTAAYRNSVSGDWSSILGGWRNSVTGNYSAVIGGQQITISGTQSGVVAGSFSSISGSNSAILSGNSHNNSSNNAAIISGYVGTTRGITAYSVFASSAPFSTTLGSAQAGVIVIGAATTDATPTVLKVDGGAVGSTNQVILPNNSAYLFKATVIATVTGGGDTSGWKLEGVIKRGSGVGTAAIVGLVSTTLLGQNAGAATWAVTATADTTNGGLAITVTGQASTTIRWVCKVDTTEVTY